MWKHPQGIDRREGPPLYGWILLVIPVHSLLARSKYILCESKSAGLQLIRDKLPQLKGVNLRSRQHGGPNGRDRWMVDLTELSMQPVMKRYCRPRAVDFSPAINTKHLIANLLSMTEPEPPNLLQLGAHPALMGPIKAIARQLPNLMMSPDRFQGNEHAIRPSGSLPWDLPCEGLYLLIQTCTGCIFQLKVPPFHTVELLKQDIGTAILKSPSVFELYFREKALNDQEPLHEYGCLLLISLQSPTLPDKTFDTAVERHCHNALLPRQPPASCPASCPPALDPGRSQCAIRQATPALGREWLIMVNPWGPPAGGAGGPAPEPNCGFGGTGKGGEEKMGGAAGGKSESTKTHQDQDESGDFCRLPAL